MSREEQIINERKRKLENLRDIRNWRNNIIYLTTKNQIEQL